MFEAHHQAVQMCVQRQQRPTDHDLLLFSSPCIQCQQGAIGHDLLLFSSPCVQCHQRPTDRDLLLFLSPCHFLISCESLELQIKQRCISILAAHSCKCFIESVGASLIPCVFLGYEKNREGPVNLVMYSTQFGMQLRISTHSSTQSVWGLLWSHFKLRGWRWITVSQTASSYITRSTRPFRFETMHVICEYCLPTIPVTVVRYFGC